MTSSSRHGRRIAGSLAAGAMILGLVGCNTRYGATLQRNEDPVVLAGAQLPKLIGTPPRNVVGYSWDGSAWHQVPVQVDERDLVSPGAIYHLPTAAYPVLYGTTTPFKILVYTPPSTATADYRSDPTYTPTDSDPTLDSGTYLATYKMSNGSMAPNNSWGFNPESSTVVTPSYTLHYGDRWLNDGMSVIRNGATGTQLLDRSKYFATSPGCPRTEDTFDGGDSGEGAFIVNISGPVRAIRSYMGANSFKWTSVVDTYYPSRQDTTIELRGHAGMPGFGQADDLATGLTGMTYTDPANSALPIDGAPDAFTPITSTSGDAIQPPSWQLISGQQGSVVTSRSLSTSIADLLLSTTYSDESPAAVTPCTGDASLWGQHGFTSVSPTLAVPVTDPTLASSVDTYTVTRVRYFQGPGVTAAQAAHYDEYAKHPIAVAVSGRLAD